MASQDLGRRDALVLDLVGHTQQTAREIYERVPVSAYHKDPDLGALDTRTGERGIKAFSQASLRQSLDRLHTQGVLDRVRTGPNGTMGVWRYQRVPGPLSVELIALRQALENS